MCLAVMIGMPRRPWTLSPNPKPQVLFGRQGQGGEGGGGEGGSPQEAGRHRGPRRCPQEALQLMENFKFKSGHCTLIKVQVQTHE